LEWGRRGLVRPVASLAAVSVGRGGDSTPDPNRLRVEVPSVGRPECHCTEGLLVVTPDQGGGVRRVTVAWLVPRGRAAIGACLPTRCFRRLAWVVIAQKHLCGRSFHGFATEEKGVRMVKGGTTYIQTYVCIYIVCIYRERTCASLYICIWRGAGGFVELLRLIACGRSGRCCSLLALLCVASLP